MPLPAIHLFISNSIAPRFPIHDKSKYLLGSLAPDAIHAREKSTKDEKRELHFTSNLPEIESRINTTFDFYNKNENNSYDFILGYVIHVLVDHLWSHLLARYYLKGNCEEKNKDKIKCNYYSEVENIDFYYLEKIQNLEIIKELRNANGEGICNLTQSEVETWKDLVLDSFLKYPLYEDSQNAYFTMNKINEFVKICIREIPVIMLTGNAEYFEEKYRENYLA